ncbi:ABC transporter ATP-binding protein [Halorubrum sp. CSM-61]|uniref:ABC transporter ATP-binding protein n=1 Tax=Halorubrum sp. CSM-61 TaxID=2485838 RepID=UPI000F4C0280|nr:ABC transporter ATP-binding protein [Halorubrum sp. CSM-61]
MAPDSLLEMDGVYASYGSGHVLWDVSLDVDDGEVVGLLGRNGAGKTTTLRTISGVIKPTEGAVRFGGEDITAVPDYEISQRGISYVPEGRDVFPDLTVHENLRMGGVTGSEGIMTIEEILEWMPRLEERKSLKASKLSGGEQQMLAIGRALMSKTELLLLDEPTEGLAPQIVEDVIETIETIKGRDIPILLVEQNLNTVLEVADRVYILDQGRVVYDGSIDELRADEDVQLEYLGVGTDRSQQLD